MRVRLESDGTPLGSRVLDETSGRTLLGVESVEFRLSAGGQQSRATLQMTGLPVVASIEAAARVECDCQVDGMCPQGRRPTEDGPCRIIKTKSFIEGEKT